LIMGVSILNLDGQTQLAPFEVSYDSDHWTYVSNDLIVEIWCKC
jgi:hypothetical protein